LAITVTLLSGAMRGKAFGVKSFVVSANARLKGPDQ
jgi:hypothetical protein